MVSEQITQLIPGSSTVMSVREWNAATPRPRKDVLKPPFAYPRGSSPTSLGIGMNASFWVSKNTLH